MTLKEFEDALAKYDVVSIKLRLVDGDWEAVIKLEGDRLGGVAAPTLEEVCLKLIKYLPRLKS
jgi:hypothetical protein